MGSSIKVQQMFRVLWYLLLSTVKSYLGGQKHAELLGCSYKLTSAQHTTDIHFVTAADERVNRAVEGSLCCGNISRWRRKPFIVVRNPYEMK